MKRSKRDARGKERAHSQDASESGIAFSPALKLNKHSEKK